MIEIKVPSSIKVGGYDYIIEVSPEHDKELEDFDNWGEHSARLKRIRIRSRCSEQQFSETFLHEILHAVDEVYNHHGLNNEIVSALSQGLFQVLEQLGIRFKKGE